MRHAESAGVPLSRGALQGGRSFQGGKVDRPRSRILGEVSIAKGKLNCANHPSTAPVAEGLI